MEPVRLVNAEGKYVTTGMMPPFQRWPEVVQWGSRSFQLEANGSAGEPITYREVCCFMICDTNDLLKPADV
jgi:hypothetical protein